jgi:predicted RNA methylase
MWLFNNLTLQAALLKISILWPNKYSAPWVPSSMEVVHRMLQLADVGPEDLVYDLGCGDGRVIIVSALQYGSRAIGIEIDPLRYVWCQIWITVLGLRDRVQVIFGDFFNVNLSDADVVTCYLLPATNERLEDKLNRELQADTSIVSHNFAFPKLTLVNQDEEANLYLYRPEL